MARIERFLREKLISDHGPFSFYEINKERRTGKVPGPFLRNAQGFGRLDAGSRAGFASSGPQPPWISVLQFSIFLDGVWP